MEYMSINMSIHAHPENQQQQKRVIMSIIVTVTIPLPIPFNSHQTLSGGPDEPRGAAYQLQITNKPIEWLLEAPLQVVSHP
mmetsp:Transcript_69615/g.122821  ORF Transcript_69615/g.122821 Transcript_69615/m.122821 type:complete len:81 (+) Transcript_69615:473-715(+)